MKIMVFKRVLIKKNACEESLRPALWRGSNLSAGVIVSFIFILTCITCACHSQIIDNREGTAFTDDNFFSRDFIKSNKIKSIHGKVSTKRENEAMYEKDQFNYYEFDSEGRITVIMSTFTSLGNSKDTGIVNFVYNDKGQLVTKRRSDNYGFYSYNYEYDSAGRVTKETYCRDENAGKSKYHFVLGKQFIISSESYTYHQYVDRQYVRKYYNNYGALYQERYSYYDLNNYHTEDIYRLTLSGKESKTTYGYDEKGRLNKKTDVSYIFGYSETSDTYKYDALGNLEEHSSFRNAEQKVLRSMLYDQKTMLLSAQVMKDFDTGLIYVIRYSYNYF